MRYMGLDIGDRWIGVALSDPSGKLASPFTILERSDDTADLETINALVTENRVGGVIAGLPRMLNGSVGRQAEKVNTFIDKLRDELPVQVEVRDEWLTTVSARRIMQETGGKKARGKRDDAVAAAVLLQAFLDEL